LNLTSGLWLLDIDPASCWCWWWWWWEWKECQEQILTVIGNDGSLGQSPKEYNCMPKSEGDHRLQQCPIATTYSPASLPNIFNDCVW